MRKNRSLLISLGVLLFSVGVYAVTNCADKREMERAQRKCFSQLGLSLNVPPDQIQQVVQNDPEVVCRNQEQYETALRCVLRIGTTCLTRLGQNANILPSADKMIQGIAYLCDNVQDMDVDCASRSQAALKQCAIDKAMSAFSGNTNMDVGFIMCKSFELTNECIREVMVSCPRTMEIYSTLTVSFLIPPVCNNQGTTPVHRLTTLAPLSTARMVTKIPVLPDVRCYNQDSIQEAQRQCFEREGIALEIPEIDLSKGKQMKQGFLDAVLSNSKDIRSVCSDLPRYQHAMDCSLLVARKCLPPDYKNYIPNVHSMGRILTEICNNADVFYEECIRSKLSDLFDCGYRKGQANPSLDIKAALCRSFQWNVECQAEVLPSCGCRTTELYIRMSKDYLNPPACPAIRYPTPQCIAGTDQYLRNGSGQLGVSVLLLTILLLLTHLA